MTGAGEWGAERRVQRARVQLSGSSSLETPAERALERVLRSGHKASVLRLYLSHLHPGGPRPYHNRVARCLFDDAVQQGGGQVFACSNGDLILMAGPDAVATLGSVLLRLFRREAAAESQILGLWVLPGEEAAVRLQFTVGPDDPACADESPAPLGVAAAVGALLAATPAREFARRQRAVRIVGARMSDLFDEISLSFAAVEARLGLRVAFGADGYLLRYTTAQLQGCLLNAMAAARLAQIQAVSVNMPLRYVSTPGFTAIRQAARETSTLLGVEVDLAEAMADFDLYSATQDRLRAEGCTVILDGVDHQSLVHCDPSAFSADLLKVRWSSDIPSLSPRYQRAIARSLDAFGADRVIIEQAESEAALVWGRAHGVTCFQGRHVDLMLAADRIRGCAHSAGCSMRQCLDRGSGVDDQVQAGCAAPSLLGGRLQWDVGRVPAMPS